jgi:hypothetical protein
MLMVSGFFAFLVQLVPVMLPASNPFCKNSSLFQSFLNLSVLLWVAPFASSGALCALPANSGRRNQEGAEPSSGHNFC